jgi:hypothetical protein
VRLVVAVICLRRWDCCRGGAWVGRHCCQGRLGGRVACTKSPGEVIGAATVAELVRGRAWSVAFTPDAVPALARVSPLSWTGHPLLALFAAGAGPGRVVGSDRVN